MPFITSKHKMTKVTSADIESSEPLLPTSSDETSLNSTTSSHIEPHFKQAEIIRDIVIGLSDGLTVPFALAAGLASFDNSRIVVVAGAAELVAGCISMGIGKLDKGFAVRF